MSGRAQSPRAIPAMAAFASAVALAFACALAPAARAQDFAGPAPAGPAESPATFLERALPPAAPAATLAALAVRWDGVDELVTRGLAAGIGWGPARGAIGVSQTGDWELGWTGVAGAAGAAFANGACGLRFAARRDREADAAPLELGPTLGVETGFAAWIAPAPDFVGWASAPAVWRRGAAPPLERALELGVRWRSGDAAAWLAHRAPPRGIDDSGERVGGLSLVFGATRVWLEARDRPLRGSLGIEARVHGVALGCEVDSHPVLEETARLGVTLGGVR
ncbi:MAG TPA: hypothetical protein VL332_10585 [Candidatus Saccharimonadaceae bacterium]|nr:hypothetical protein [Candidatus Saccharimonadaceae bacterium]